MSPRPSILSALAVTVAVLALDPVATAQPSGRLFYTDGIAGTPGIGSSDLQGQDPYTLLPKDGAYGYQGMDVDPVNCHVYYPFQNTIERVNYNGTDRRTILASPPFAFAPQAVSLDLLRGKIYWYSNNTNRFGCCDLDGSNAQVLVKHNDMVPPIAPRSIEVDPVGGKFYWFDQWYQGWRRANLDGSGREDLFTTPTIALATAVDRSGGMIYWTEGANLYRRAKDGSGSSQLVAQHNNPLNVHSLAVSSNLDRIFTADDSTLLWTTVTNPGTFQQQQVVGQGGILSIGLHEGTEVQLSASATSFVVGDPMTLRVRGAQPLAVGLLYAIAVNGTPTLVQLMVHSMDAEGAWSVTTLVPPGLAGLTLDLADLTLTPTGRVRFTDPVSLQFF